MEFVYVAIGIGLLLLTIRSVFSNPLARNSSYTDADGVPGYPPTDYNYRDSSSHDSHGSDAADGCGSDGGFEGGSDGGGCDGGGGDGGGD